MKSSVQYVEPRSAILRPAIGLSLVSLLGFGLLYSSVATGLGQLLFPVQSNGSLIEKSQRIEGSSLVAQNFQNPRYFMSRPSAANYDPMALSGSNLAVTNPDLKNKIEQRLVEVAQQNHIAKNQIPSDLVTASGSGIDPHISPEAAQLQVERIAQLRHLSTQQVIDIVHQHTESKQFGLLGQARVNVLELNLALDQLHP
ncbi:potassium-transporting ATPase subunit KdpC [Acinetobacter ursingii]|uniref:Potassium-transporting ATPase KdpC subunit n=2 Tax=Acinetobacter TaxID=469 RepID=N9BZT6_9GAMM|nr:MULTISPECIES: potassium-transporting ATPase subunit KdpC [Acinetobacter]ENV79067.1 K+-transporting ATPase, C subunit [Acinetobacter ursingii ANC 3649]MDG9948459.1 potassium-transporting ATPase subunit KdpC [Acinetobacter ursingii]MEC6126109.1 potassium-transporting ATPase subunit KdpC [Acinetobacter ursingii]PZT89120.1 MAG: potassium-transporting ATPase subunit KdpC [Acinetobacter sp.]QXZ23886.1 potassium-transporting ATPase subunit KdpC [Acinetobacter septicus]